MVNRVGFLVLVVVIAAPYSIWAGEPVCPGAFDSVDINDPGDIRAVAISDGLAISVDDLGVSTWDLTDPSLPIRLGSFEFPRGSHPNSVFPLFEVFIDRTQKWACMLPGFECFDIRDLTRPQPFGWGTSEWPSHFAGWSSDSLPGVAINDRLIAARHAESGNPRDVWLLDLSRPGPREWIKPEILRSSDFVRGIGLMDNLLLVMYRFGHFDVFDVTHPTEPEFLSRSDLSGWGTGDGVVIGGENVAFLSLDVSPNVNLGERYLVDLSDPRSPIVHELSYDLLWHSLFQIVFDGDSGVAYIKRYGHGVSGSFLEEFDFSDPASPIIVASRESPIPYALAVSPDIVIAAPNGSHLLAMRRDSDLETIGQSFVAGEANDMEVEGDLAVVANGPAGVLTLDLSDPEKPEVVGRVDLDADVLSVRLRETTAFALSRDTLWAIDCSAPDDPSLSDHVTVEGAFSLLTLDGGTAVAASSTGSPSGGYAVHVVDVSDPTRLVRRSQFMVQPDPYGQITALSARSGYLYLIAGWHLLAFDIRDPDNPVQVDDLSVRTSPGFNFIEFSGDIIVMTSPEKVEIVDVSDPHSLKVVREFSDMNGSYVGAAGPEMMAIAGNHGTYLADFSDLDHPVTYDAPEPPRSWSAGAIVDDRWLRPSGYVIDIVSLECRPPVVEIGKSGLGPTVWFEDLSRFQVSERMWDFGDGETSDDPNPVHSYTDAGSYTVTLTVSNPNGMDTATKTIDIGPILVRRQPPGSRRP